MIPDVPDLGSEDLRSMQRSTFGAARNSSQNRTKWFGAARLHGRNFENLQMFKNPVLLSCTEIPANPGCSVILGILTT